MKIKKKSTHPITALKDSSIFEQEVLLGSPQATRQFAKRLGSRLEPGSVLALCGGLGSGKTTFMKGLAEGLGVDQSADVKSPTFVLMHIYEGRVPVAHFDLYRLESKAEIETLGLEDFLNNSDVVTCVEWADRTPENFPPETYWLFFEVVGENKRRLKIFTHGKKE